MLDRLTIANSCARISACASHAGLRLLIGTARSRLLLVNVCAGVDSARLTTDVLRRAVGLHLLLALDSARATYTHRRGRLLLSLRHLLIITIHLTLIVAAICTLEHGHRSINVLIYILVLHHGALLIIIVDSHLRAQILRILMLKLLIADRVETLKNIH